MRAHGQRTPITSALAFLAPLAGLLLVLGLFSLMVPDRFLSAYNLRTIGTQTVIVALGAIGMTFVIVSAGIDLSVGSVIALSSVVTALLLRSGLSPSVSALGGVATGSLSGMINGVLIRTLRVVPFIVTLGTMGITRGVAKYLAHEQKVDAPSGWLGAAMTKAPTPEWLIVAPGVWLTIVLAIVMGFVLRSTVFGTYAFAIGSNEATARLCGVRVPRIKTAVYVLSGTFAALAGVMQFARLTVGDPTTALGKELDIIAAVVIGGASLSGGRASLLGSMVGALLMASLANGCTLVGVPNYVQEIITGIIIVVAVAIDRARGTRSVRQ